MNKKPSIVHLAALLTVTAISCTLIFCSCSHKNMIDNMSRASDAQPHSREKQVGSTTQKPALDDILAVAYNAVRGTVQSIVQREDHIKVILDVDRAYVTEKDREISSATVSVAYSSDIVSLAEGDECIMIVSLPSEGAVPYRTDASYICITPRYNIIKNTEKGWRASDFMEIAKAGAFTPDEQYYDLDDIEKILIENSGKFKSYGALQLVPPN